MAAKYTETEVPEGDVRTEMITTVVGHDTWLLISATVGDGDGLSLKVETGGTIRNTETIRNLLQKTLDALP